MSEQIDQSREYVLRGTGWKIDETTFVVFDEAHAVWMARATTTHFHERNEPERSFTILNSRGQYITLDDSEMTSLKSHFMR